jgi:hypothetical protein
MNTLKKYLLKLQNEEIYINPVQTRPKPKPGISKEKVKAVKPGVIGPTGLQVDLDKDENLKQKI